MVISGEVIKSIRKKLKLTQDELATALDLSRELINKMENGNLPVSKSSKIIIKKYMEEKNITSENISHIDHPVIGQEVKNEIQDDGKPLELIAALRIIEKQQETIHFLTAGKSQGGDQSSSKNASG